MPGSIRRRRGTPGTWTGRRAVHRAARPRRWPAGCAMAAIGTQTGGLDHPAGLVLRRRGHEAERIRRCAPLGVSTPGSEPRSRRAPGAGGRRTLAIPARHVVKRFASRMGETSNVAGPRPTDRRGSSRLRGFFDRRADPAMRSALEDAVSILACSRGGDRRPRRSRRFRGRSSTIIDASWPPKPPMCTPRLLEVHPDDYPPRIPELIDEGRSVTALDYIRPQRNRTESISRLQLCIHAGRCQD